MDMNKVTKTDMRLIEKLIPYTSPAEIPLSFQYGDRLVRGIPADFHPRWNAGWWIPTCCRSW